MQVFDKKFLKGRLRKVFGDDHGIQWSDTLLDEILKEACREYALFSGSLVGVHEIISGGESVYRMPDNFYKAIRAVDASGKDLPFVSYRKLIEEYGDFREIRGDKVKSLCFNFDNFGEFRIFPILPSGMKVGKIYYKMLPEDEGDLKNVSAIEQHCLFQMYQFMGKPQAGNCYSEFMKLVSREESSRVFNGRKDVFRTGVYF